MLQSSLHRDKQYRINQSDLLLFFLFLFLFNQSVTETKTIYFLCDLYAELRASGVVLDVRHFGDVILKRRRERETRERAQNSISLKSMRRVSTVFFLLLFFFFNCASWSFHLFQALEELFSIEI